MMSFSRKNLNDLKPAFNLDAAPDKSEEIDPIWKEANRAYNRLTGISRDRTPDPARCHWRPVVNPDHGWQEYWEGECGAQWEFTDHGSPATDNDMRFCPWCGRALVEVDGE